MEGSILELLAQHESLGFEQIVAHLAEPPDLVRSALADLRESRFVDVLSVGDPQAHSATAAAYWRLTDAGHRELSRRRSGH